MVTGKNSAEREHVVRELTDLWLELEKVRKECGTASPLYVSAVNLGRAVATRILSDAKDTRKLSWNRRVLSAITVINDEEDFQWALMQYGCIFLGFEI